MPDASGGHKQKLLKMNTSNTFAAISKSQALALLVWKNTIGSGNWGGWGKYPELPVSASYLQYDTNPLQINLDKPVTIDGEQYNCITNGRPVGAKWNSPISFNALQKAFAITDNEIAAEILAIEKNERRALVKRWLDNAKAMQVNDKYKPFALPIEQVFLKSDRSGENYFSEYVTVVFGHTPKPEFLLIPESVEWHQVRTQGKNGPNKKRVFVPVSLSENAQRLIAEKLAELQAQRVQSLKNEIEKYENELAS